MTHFSGSLFVISGPAGSGKTTLCDRLVQEYAPKVERAITVTTRSPRLGEKDKVDYIFLSKETFEAKIQNNEFYEYALVHGNYYGSLKATINSKLEQNIHLLLNIDVQGAQSFRDAAKKDSKLADKLVTIFVCPSTLEELEKRLTSRNQDSSQEIQKRLRNAQEEMQHRASFDHCILSKSKEEDFAELVALAKL